jgi:riboflavin biosynthesis pyrimidine reductase
MAQILANLIIARNGATSIRGSSRPLSTPEDRKRFHALRKGASAIAIGGSTFRTEPYENLKIPLFVATRDSSTEIGGSSSDVRFYNLSPLELLQVARKEIEGAILIEGGVNFLRDLIAAQVIDQIYISRVDLDGDDYLLDEEALRLNYRLVSTESIGETNFEIWEPNHALKSSNQ